MIDINKLKKSDIGKKVVYTNGVGEQEPGIIKSWNDKWIFVVYHCDNNWENYQNYTAASTNPNDLFWDS